MLQHKQGHQIPSFQFFLLSFILICVHPRIFKCLPFPTFFSMALDSQSSVVWFFFYIYSLVNLVVFVRVLGTCYGKETSRFCQAQNFEASFFCTAHFITSACSFNIGLALLLGIRSLDPRPRARTAPALA